MIEKSLKGLNIGRESMSLMDESMDLNGDICFKYCMLPNISPNEDKS